MFKDDAGIVPSLRVKKISFDFGHFMGLKLLK